DGNALRRAARLPASATAAQRHAAAAAAHPDAAAARRYLTSHGFTVTGGDGWTLTARGPRDVATTLAHALRADVAGLGRTATWRRHAVPAGHTGATLASAYDVVRPGSTGAGLGIATVQFSGWRSADLTTYAQAAGIPAPSPVQVVVGAADPTDTSNGGDFEVALDQEVLLATAPQAQQRLYFGENSLADAVALYSRIATDAEAGLVDVVSTSWGMCEPYADFDPPSRAGMETQLARIVAAGATVFAASGDFGAYDCSSPDSPDNTVAVDYPAASPWVVGVGGTDLAGSAGAWSESAWTDALTGAFKGYAGGGGQSSSVTRPAWQAGLALPGTNRLVPDIAAMADPDHGFGVYSYLHGGWNLGGGTSAAAPLVAGHLAAALSSAGRTAGVGDVHDELYGNPGAFRDVTTGSNLRDAAGLGYDLATGLGSPQWSALATVLFGDPVVAAPAATSSLTVPLDVTPVAGMTVTAWTAGEGTTVACDPDGSATPPTEVVLADGADRATHVSVAALDGNAVCHVGTAPVLLDRAAPVASGSLKSLTGADARTVVRWSATDGTPASGVASYDVCVYAVGYGCQWTATGTTATTATVTLSPGRTYVLRVTPRDRAGNTGARLTTTAKYVLPMDGRSFTPSKGWGTTYAKSDWYGSHWMSATRGAYATKTTSGTKYELFYVAHPSGGYFDVYVDGVRVKRVNTYASTTAYRRVTTVATYAKRGSHTVKVVVLGSKDSRSRGYGVAFDAMRVTY
ncbi:MAG TPA: S53 family peptidase, partial [Mycobacteriales bacterium]|nr:S53 family peptidase [Mycobacteriales bacterium]